MRKLVVAVFVSLDGVMQAPGGPTEDPTGGFAYGGWIVPFSDGVTGAWVMELFAEPFDLLLGRRTYEIFAAYWPFMPQDHPIAEPFNRVTKYVASRKGTPLTWQNSVAIDDAATGVSRLKQDDGPRLVVQGSSDLIQSLLAQGLVDELRLITYPVILGHGKRLFGAGTPPRTLTVCRRETSATGAALSVYQPAGPVQSSSFATLEPHPLEIARQQRMRDEG
jgi:dihydrofolate reductase